MTGVSLILQTVSRMRSAGVTPSRIVAGPKAYEALRYSCLIPPWGGDFMLLGIPVERNDGCSSNYAHVLSTNVEIVASNSGGSFE